MNVTRMKTMRLLIENVVEHLNNRHIYLHRHIRTSHRFIERIYGCIFLIIDFLCLFI